MSEARALVIGRTGMVGRSWCDLLAARDQPFDALGRTELNLADLDAIDAAVREDHRLVINCAAWTDVDGAESDEAGATRVNGDAVARLAARCKALGATLVHYSTDYVFNGAARAPYRIDQPREPINAYGRSKAAGERALEASGCDYLLIRTSWVYAPWGKNFVRTMVKLTREKDRLKVVNDQRGRPTSAQHLAAATDALLGKGARGTYHVCDGGECTWYDFTREIAAHTGATCAIEPCTSAEFPRPAKRPAYSVLDLSAAEALLGPMPPWQQNLAAVLDQIALTTNH